MKKGFYASLAVGVVAIAAVAIITAQNTGSQEQPEHLAQIEEQETKKPVATPQSRTPETTAPLQTSTPVKENKAPAESVEPKTEKTDIKTTQPKETKAPEKSKEPEVSQVMSGADTVKKISFKEEDGLIWPIMGDVILKYSMDKSIYFKTLGQYKVNPAMVIEAKEDSEVLSAAQCVVTDISEDEETGMTLTATLGDGYEVVYGQLKDIKAKIGDTIEKGSVIGKIAKPTKYYVEEGSNLYFEVLQNGEPIDPMLLLE